MTRQALASRLRFKDAQSPAKFALMAALYREQVGEAIRARREELGISQSVLADRVEGWLRENRGRENGKPFDAQNISRWERGVNMAEPDNLEAVAAGLETTVPVLIGSIQAPDAPKRVPTRDEIRRELDEIRLLLRRLLAAQGLDPDAAAPEEADRAAADALAETREGRSESEERPASTRKQAG